MSYSDFTCCYAGSFCWLHGCCSDHVALNGKQSPLTFGIVATLPPGVNSRPYRVSWCGCFVTRIIADQIYFQSQNQKKTLYNDLKKDLLCWKLFLDVNGVQLLVPQTVACNILGDATLTDAGAWDEAAEMFWSGKFPCMMQSADVLIHLKEFLTLIISVRIWGHR